MVMKGAEDTLSQLQKFRLAGYFCDVTLTVGHDQVQAHRNVLAAGSEYFRTLFLGQFKEASFQNLDLSEVTDNVTELENVVDFMYTQNVEINDDNLESLVKLSTFLLIDGLRERCMRYMKKKPSLRAWLNYYFLAVEHSLDETEIKGNRIVMSRFNDYFIHEYMSDLTTDEVQLLLNKDMFQHCSASSMLQFLFRWLPDEATDQHVSVASQILDKMNTETTDCLSEQQKFESKQSLLQIEEKFHNKRNRDVKIFLEKSQKILTQIGPKPETGSNCQENVESSCASTTILSSGSKEVIVTVSPKQCVVDKFRQFPIQSYWYQTDEKITFKEPTFTLCCYIPRTQTWYHIQDFKTEAVIADLPDHCGKSYAVKAFLLQDKLALVCCQTRIDVYIYSLRNKSWKVFYLPNCEQNENESVIEFCLVNGDDCLYLIVKMGVERLGSGSNPIIPAAEYFMGFRFMLDEEWGPEQIFTTEKESNSYCDFCELQAKVSSVSNELMFICCPLVYFAGDDVDEEGSSYVYIVDLNDKQPKAVNLLKELHFNPREEFKLKGVRILQTQSHFYIVNDGTVESNTRDVRIVYEYKFKSQCLGKYLQPAANKKDGETTTSEERKHPDDAMPKELDKTTPQNETNTESEREILDETKAQNKEQTSLRINQLKGAEEGTFPCCEQLTLSNKNSLWSFEGDRNFVSVLHEVKIEDDGEMKLHWKEHTPPPFSCVSLMAVGELPADLVAQWTPVDKFHHSTSKQRLEKHKGLDFLDFLD